MDIAQRQAQNTIRLSKVAEKLNKLEMMKVYQLYKEHKPIRFRWCTKTIIVC
jgi:hypothetical protein